MNRVEWDRGTIQSTSNSCGFFATVVCGGTISKAAISLSVTQPVITRQIRALEEEPGVKLFYRNGRGVVLIEAGQLLQHRAEEIIDAVAKVKNAVKASTIRAILQGGAAICALREPGELEAVALWQVHHSQHLPLSPRRCAGENSVLTDKGRAVSLSDAGGRG